MSNVKISELSSASTLTGTEEVPVVQSGTTVRTTTQDIANLGGGASYTSYVAKISGTGTPTATILSNTTGLTFTWANGTGDYAPGYYYTATVSSVAAAKIAVFITGKAVLLSGKSNTYVGPNTSYVVTAVNGTTATVDLWYDTGTSVTEGTELTAEIRIYP